MSALADSGLDVTECSEVVRLHLAFRCSSAVVFVVGLPGSGKSRVRKMLANRLIELGVQVNELTDYVYAYRDFVHSHSSFSRAAQWASRLVPAELSRYRTIAR